MADSVLAACVGDLSRRNHLITLSTSWPHCLRPRRLTSYFSSLRSALHRRLR
jgi:hypothetical protein